MKKLIVLIGLFVAFSASAKDCEKEEDSGGMAAVRACIEAETEKPVILAYNQLIKALGARQAAIDSIKIAQEDWLRFRNSTCAYGIEDGGNSAGTNCIVEFNDARIKTLNRYAKEAKANN